MLKLATRHNLIVLERNKTAAKIAEQFEDVERAAPEIASSGNVHPDL